MIESATSTALLGAGISVDAGLPTAVALIDALVDSLVHRAWARDAVKELARPGRANPHDVLRFETLLLWVQDVFDDELELFGFLDSYQQPASLHLRFARAAREGMLLLTTNFDDLLERAILDEGGVARTVDAHTPRPRWTDTPVIKLHGTRQMHDAGRVSDSRKPLHTTTEVIAAANPGLLLNQSATDVLVDNVNDRHLVVAGYSASDDLDIVPALRTALPRQVTWIDHAGSTPEQLELADLRAGSSSWLVLLRHWSSKGVPITVWRGPTDTVAEMLGLSRTQDPGDIWSDAWQANLRQWARRVRVQDPTGLGFAGLVLAEMQRYEPAERAMRESRGTRRDPSAGWTSARRRYEIAQCALLKEGSDPHVARRLGMVARREALRTGDHQSALFSQLLIGRAAFLVQDWSEAAASFESAIEDAQTPEHRAYAQSWLGRTHVWSGTPESAFAPLRSAIRVMRREGNLEGLLDALDGLGLAELWRGQLTRAQTHLSEAHTIAEMLGFEDRKFTLKISLANVAFTAGRLDEAETWLADAFDLDQADNDEASVAWAIQADLDLEKGRPYDAREAVDSAIAATTVVTRGELAGLHGLRAELLLGLSDPSGARKAARHALESPASESTWSAAVHAHAILVSLGDEAADSLDDLLALQPGQIPPPTLMRISAMLVRLGVTSRRAEALRKRALSYATRVGAPHWLAQLAT